MEIEEFIKKTNKIGFREMMDQLVSGWSDSQSEILKEIKQIDPELEMIIQDGMEAETNMAWAFHEWDELTKNYIRPK